MINMSAMFCPLCRNKLSLSNRSGSTHIVNGINTPITTDTYICDNCGYGEVKSYTSSINYVSNNTLVYRYSTNEGKAEVARCENCNYIFTNHNLVMNCNSSVYKCPVCGSVYNKNNGGIRNGF